MADLNRRAALSALAAAAVVVTWRGSAHAASAGSGETTDRVRAGGRVTLTCPGATAFHLALGAAGAHGVAVVAAPSGTAVFRVPVLDAEEGDPGTRPDEWTPLTCTPLRDGVAISAPRALSVLTAPVSFGT